MSVHIFNITYNLFFFIIIILILLFIYYLKYFTI